MLQDRVGYGGVSDSALACGACKSCLRPGLESCEEGVPV